MALPKGQIYGCPTIGETLRSVTVIGRNSGETRKERRRSNLIIFN